MARFVLYPNLLAEMARKGETTTDIGKLLKLDRSQVYRKLNGQAKWTIGDAEILYEHYGIDMYTLFKKNRKENKDENIIKN